MVEEVLPHVPYAGVAACAAERGVPTIPKMLRRYFLWDRALYGELCRCAYAATRRFFEAPACAAERNHRASLERAVPAMVVSPQSWGSLLNHHPHCHALTSLGVFTRDAVFHPLPDDADFAPLEELFREEVLSMMLGRELISQERVELLRSWRHSGFHANADRRLAAEDRTELESLLQYMERPPVSLARLEYLPDSRVLYRGKFNPSLGRDHQLCCAVEFLAMLVPHIALRYESRIRTYGARLRGRAQ